ncbi:2-oxo acid dehydrogenase subunit E2 [Kitasatospora viridis]|uniref:2-oxoacid dehydrogenase/acyltransferase catalytic subunit n=1 Tax=Kitasatospora viridis TaxID=281105 RepID=A0A561UJV5_9ACTN|nr:2-oxo acid dehydrogenase subunit E2 [Kitasatospora viridis]TWF99637.1 2-oxoacid dehydrogenase/acyltransferase catalytic subunit [Kitasatospora viridis]
MSATVRPLPAARKGTYTFLRDARNTCHVYLVADVDATRLREARAATDGRASYVSFVVKAAAEVIARTPAARSVLTDGLRPKVAELDEIHAKVLFDKTVDGTRCVVSGTVESVQDRSLLEVQDRIDTYKNAALDDPDGPFARLRKVQKLPLPLAGLLYRLAMRDPLRRAALQGVFSVTSVGHEPVRAIFPMISGTLGFGIGRIVDTPVAVDGEVRVAPVLTLSLAFDHRVLDGAAASEVLARTKHLLETWEMP